MKNIYPGSVPEFRILKKLSGETVFQIRYIKSDINYIGRWYDIPVVEEQSLINISAKSTVDKNK